MTEDPRWLVVTLHRGHELAACAEIEAKDGFRAFVPYFLKRVRKGRRWVMAPRPLFGPYGFASANGVPWQALGHMRHVGRVVTWECTGEPQYVPSDFMSDLLKGAGTPVELDEDESPPARRFKHGQPVRIISGPHTGVKGIFARHEEERVKVLFHYLGAEREINLPADMIEERS